MKKIVLSKKLIFIAITAIFITVSCDKLSILNKGVLIEKKIIVPENYGNGVYYFNCTDQEFAESLSAFLQDDTKEVSAIVNNSAGAYSAEKGYFVVIKNDKTINNHLISN